TSNSTLLNAWGSYDHERKPINFSWKKTAGPNSYNSLYEGSSTPVISNLVDGTYTFQLTVTDVEGASATDEVNLTVMSIASIAGENAAASVSHAGTQKLSDLTGHANEIKTTVYPNPVMDGLNLKW